jgi:hypothetical protein
MRVARLIDALRAFGHVPASRETQRQLRSDRCERRLEDAIARERCTRAARAGAGEMDVHFVDRDADDVHLASIGADEWREHVAAHFENLLFYRSFHEG